MFRPSLLRGEDAAAAQVGGLNLQATNVLGRFHRPQVAVPDHQVGQLAGLQAAHVLFVKRSVSVAQRVDAAG